MRGESRRSFLRRMGGVGAASLLSGRLPGRASLAQTSPATTLPALGSQPTTPGIEETAKSLVVHVRREEVVDGPRLHELLMRDMVEDGICVLTATRKPEDAWHKLLAAADVIGIKFNQVGFDELGTGELLAVQLVKSLGSAGFRPEQIVLLEAPYRLARELKTKPRPFGWSGPEVSFGSGSEQLAAVLQEITAIINVPSLKTHNIAGMTGCLKNLSHALVRRPGLYHANGCAPFVGDIVALPQIRSKLRLHVVNAIRALFDGGPAVKSAGTWNYAGILVSRDGVAADSVALDILNEQRARAKLPPVGNAAGQIAHVHAAAQRGLGTDDQDYIRIQDVPLEWVPEGEQPGARHAARQEDKKTGAVSTAPGS